jgi:hypothetical protein
MITRIMAGILVFILGKQWFAYDSTKPTLRKSRRACPERSRRGRANSLWKCPQRVGQPAPEQSRGGSRRVPKCPLLCHSERRRSSHCDDLHSRGTCILFSRRCPHSHPEHDREGHGFSHAAHGREESAALAAEADLVMEQRKTRRARLSAVRIEPVP